MADNTVISLVNVSKVFKRYQRPADRLKEILFPGKSNTSEFWALRDINLEISKGETVGIIGRNGAGKSTLLQIIAGTLQPTVGNVDVNGRVAALLELGSGFNPEFTGHQNIFFNGRLLGLTQTEIEDRYDQIAEFADIGDFIHQPVKTYSSGMFVRLAFAVQANIDASIVIIDEALAVGDVFFRQKCYIRLEQLRASGASILLVSHSMPDIEQHCKRAILLDHGMTKFVGNAGDATKHYYLLHQMGSNTKSVETPEQSFPQRVGVTQPQQISNIALTTIPTKAQVTNHQAICVGFALWNKDAQLCNVFRQGDRAIFYYEFDIKESIEIPICGIVIKSDRGVIVHGKNTWQTCDNVLRNLDAGHRLACKQEIVLDLQPGEYSFEIGLASISQELWDKRNKVSHQEMSAKRLRICHIANAGCFSVGLKIHHEVEILTHYGLANLPGKITMYNP
ncbi:MAG: ABC transporter ATP-binding protein [Bacteroidota bacterium]